MGAEEKLVMKRSPIDECVGTITFVGQDRLRGVETVLARDVVTSARSHALGCVAEMTLGLPQIDVVPANSYKSLVMERPSRRPSVMVSTGIRAGCSRRSGWKIRVCRALCWTSKLRKYFLSHLVAIGSWESNVFGDQLATHRRPSRINRSPVTSH